VDPDNAEFVIFVRAKKFPQWYPLSVVKGGSAANVLVKAMESELGRKLSGNTLVRNIGTVRCPAAPRSMHGAATAAHGCQTSELQQFCWVA